MGAYRIVLMILLLLACVSATPPRAEQALRAESKRYSIVVRILADSDSYTGKVLVVDTVRKQSAKRTVDKKPTSASRLLSLVFPSEDRLVAHGKFEGDKGDVLAVIDLDQGKIIDAIWGWQASFSPNKKMVAYAFRYPPYIVPRWIATNVILAYDFSRNPRDNSMNDESRAIRDSENQADGWNPLNRGFILYPDANRAKRKYHVPIDNPAEQRTLTSPISWGHSGSKIAFLEGHGGQSVLVVIDVTQGLANPVVRQHSVDKSRFYDEAAMWRPEYETAVVVAKTLRFTDDEKAVVINSWNTGPFGNKEITIKIE